MKVWRKFCNLFDLDKVKDNNQICYIYFAAWRFQHPKEYAASSISGEISHIIAAYNANTLEDPIDRKKYRLLNQLFSGMKRIKGREPKHSNPCRNSDLEIMLTRFNQNKYSHILWKSMILFGKNLHSDAVSTLVKLDLVLFLH